jgi:hypothetical protein
MTILYIRRTLHYSIEKLQRLFFSYGAAIFADHLIENAPAEYRFEKNKTCAKKRNPTSFPICVPKKKKRDR